MAPLGGVNVTVVGELNRPVLGSGGGLTLTPNPGAVPAEKSAPLLELTATSPLLLASWAKYWLTWVAPFGRFVVPTHWPGASCTSSTWIHGWLAPPPAGRTRMTPRFTFVSGVVTRNWTSEPWTDAVTPETRGGVKSFELDESTVLLMSE